MKQGNELPTEAYMPQQEAYMPKFDKRLNPAREYSRRLNSEIIDLNQRLKELQTYKQIASFLERHSATEIHEMIENVDREIRNIQ